MALRGAASRSFLAAVRARTAAAAPRLRPVPAPAPAPRRIPTVGPSSSAPFATARPLAALMGSLPAVAARLTGYSASSARACCELSQGTFCRTCQDR
ncbi:uncharacterized protein [Lolium perenne]|uniref:uncharacterized protein isoform X1 n=1 Tax=Lolium perenne TaxID=4522 RepID=UPI0021F514B4|nr:uncharacterized protein LOC127293802 isoform X2 [Lolium perenne]